ncbi:PREDICTED: uncharacterized protein LOC106742231 [Dinoponera quadriceps]|uniref:Uncharacterized protein LOC106742231 n=1 Tax=Dinoponera quadriceps TaxID=609295 RepID=A0A6P3WX32_DINQU|nr:PREDICTED: uncharacterized protein LOC106742231 [Dinoponera quadriceps]
MDFQDDVKKVTSLPLADQAKFYQLTGLCQADKDRKMNERKVKNPRNLLLLEDDIDDNVQENDITHAEDPEVYIHPLRMGVNVKRFKNIDFTVPRVGKKIKEAPQQYFLRTTTDDSFKFVKKDKSTM